MNGTSTATPATGITEYEAADQIASFLSADEGEQQAGSEEEDGEEGQQAHDDAEADEGEDGGEADEAEESDQDDEEEEQEEDDAGEGLSDDTRIKLGDEEITLGDLKRGHLRHADYTRKTQALAEERKQLAAASDEERNGLRAERAQFVQGITQLQELQKQFQPQEPNWQELYETDPARYAAERELHRTFAEQQMQLEAARKAALQQSHEDYKRELSAYVKEETGKLLEAKPEWKDAKVAAAAKQDMRAAALALGFNDEDLANLTDHRALLVLHKAAEFDKLMAKKAALKPVQVKKASPRPAKPGNATTVPNSRVSEATRARQRLAKTGKVNDAASAIEHLIPDDFI